ncbi:MULTISPECIES: hypothetical protein [Bacillus]|uniref:hypothetical protein n=1 Tax=Bacillus TaxID=1386 RepID=UPI000956A978|nr:MULTISPECIES: hypothetical protein [Bacillus]MEC1699337.1 hypothetical protein [Bacillus velezensis]MEC3667702.1 hypothetical protein [Bacillus velezensis]NMW10132.1 hypothetical protein [Bacillus velezensis]QIR35042.1 hypothetical protein BVELS4_03815 [Bacillus velezensis]SIS04750.1 hypothetical protein SAMN05880571_1939 [Bacillus velezensis]
MMLLIFAALTGYLVFSFSKDNRRKTPKTSPLVTAADTNNIIDLNAIRQKRRMPIS